MPNRTLEEYLKEPSASSSSGSRSVGSRKPRTISEYLTRPEKPSYAKPVAQPKPPTAQEIVEKPIIAAEKKKAELPGPRRDKLTTPKFIPGTALSQNEDTSSLFRAEQMPYDKNASKLAPRTLVSVPYKPTQIPVSADAPWWKKVVGAGANAVLGMASDAVHYASEALSAQGTTQAERVGSAMMSGAGAVGVLSAPVIASFEGSRELPLGVGKVSSAAQDFVFGKIHDLAGFGVNQGLKMLPISKESKAAVESGATELANIVLTVGALHGLGKGVEGMAKGAAKAAGFKSAAEYTPKGEPMKTPAPKVNADVISSVAGKTVDLALNPLGEATKTVVKAYKDYTRKVSERVAASKAAGIEVTEPVAKKIVSDAIKEVEIPGDKGEVKFGKEMIDTEQRAVLKHLIKNGEEVDFAVDPKIDKPTFVWNFEKQKGTFTVPSVDSARSVARELGYKTATTEAPVAKFLSAIIPDFSLGKQKIMDTLYDYALEQLGGNATKVELDAKVVDIARGINGDLGGLPPTTNAGRVLGVTLRSILSGKNTRAVKERFPETAKFAEFVRTRVMSDVAKVAEPVGEKVATPTPDVSVQKAEISPGKQAAEIPSTRAEQRKEVVAGGNPVEQKKTSERAEKESRVFERLKSENPNVLDGELSYEVMNMKEDARRAVELVEKDPQFAYQVAKGLESLQDVTNTAVNIALADQALRADNLELYAELTRTRSLQQTRRGQEINMEKSSVSDNSTARYVKELLKTRMIEVGGLGKESKVTQALSGESTPYQKATKKIAKEVRKAKEKISGKQLDIAEAQKLLDSLTCK